MPPVLPVLRYHGSEVPSRLQPTIVLSEAPPRKRSVTLQPVLAPDRRRCAAAGHRLLRLLRAASKRKPVWCFAALRAPKFDESFVETPKLRWGSSPESPAWACGSLAQNRPGTTYRDSCRTKAPGGTTRPNAFGPRPGGNDRAGTQNRSGAGHSRFFGLVIIQKTMATRGRMGFLENSCGFWKALEGLDSSSSE